MGFSRFVLIVASIIMSVKSEKIRCYCNLDVCKYDDDTCSFEDGGCFSDFLDYRDTTQSRHGCLHLLDRKRQEQCRNTPGSSGGPKSLLLCCRSDMCNQVLSPVSLVTHPIIGSLINATESHNSSARAYDYRFTGHAEYNTNEVWFKAATIAVPICGAMILLMLVVLAFKILRTDHVSVEKYRINSDLTNSHQQYHHHNHHYHPTHQHQSHQPHHHFFSFKSNDLSAKDLAKKIPLLSSHENSRNSEDFRSFTSTRIHYGQNVNVLRSEEDNQVGSSKSEKNLENAKYNSERPRRGGDGDGDEETAGAASGVTETATTAATSSDDAKVTIEEEADESEELRPGLGTLSLNLDKSECLNSCNLYRSSRTTTGEGSSDASDIDKLYDKYWI